jgi:membrane protease YdiL (CAAX protease family)
MRELVGAGSADGAETVPGHASTAPSLARGSSRKAKRVLQMACRCDQPTRRRRGLAAAVALTGTGLLGASLSTKPASREFYALTFSVAGTWLIGGLAVEPLHWSSLLGKERSFGRLVALPVLTGAAAFGAFFGAALVARRIPVLNEALVSVFNYAERGSDSWVLATTLANGVAEEVFFRGSLFAALGSPHPVAASTAVYMLTTCATRNPALVVAAGVMGTVFATQRRSSGGLLAPILTHVTWSALVLRYLPALFRKSLNPGRSMLQHL